MSQIQNQPDPQQYTQLFADNIISIFYNQDAAWLYSRWEGERSLQNLVSGGNQILHYLKETGSNKMILDSTNFLGKTEEVIINEGTEFARRLSEAGLEYMAWIFGDTSLIQTTADQILTRETTEVIVLNFDNIRLAEIWLRSLN